MTAVITCLFNRFPDPQSGATWPADVAKLSVLDSIHAHGHHAVVLHDCLDEVDTDDTTFVRVDNVIPNAYWSRWSHIVDWIDANPNVAWLWCVDGGDVTMLADPLELIQPGILYIGSEPVDGPNARSVGFWWMRELHPDSAAWIGANADRPLLNCGIVGGHRRVVRDFANRLAACWPTADRTDMAAANRIAYGAGWVGRTITGHPVHTPMWSWKTSDPHAWWAHK